MDPFILAIGLPGIGKSTATKILEKNLFDYTRFNTCDIRRSLGKKRL